jgi:hypothetical protein
MKFDPGRENVESERNDRHMELRAKMAADVNFFLLLFASAADTSNSTPEKIWTRWKGSWERHVRFFHPSWPDERGGRGRNHSPNASLTPNSTGLN